MKKLVFLVDVHIKGMMDSKVLKVPATLVFFYLNYYKAHALSILTFIIEIKLCTIRRNVLEDS